MPAFRLGPPPTTGDANLDSWFLRLWDIIEITPDEDATDDAIDTVSTSLATHEADTTLVHGISDTSQLVLTTDARLSDARTPLSHTHAYGDLTDIPEAFAPASHALSAHTGNLDGSRISGSVGVDEPLDEIVAFDATFGTLVVNTMQPSTGLSSPLSGAGIVFSSLGVGNAPLASIPLGAPVSTNFDADLLDGYHATDFARPADVTGHSWVSTQQFQAASSFLASSVPFVVAAGTAEVENLWAAYASDADLFDSEDSSYYLDLTNATGTLPDARLSSNVPLLNGSNSFSAAQFLRSRVFTGTQYNTGYTYELQLSDYNGTDKGIFGFGVVGVDCWFNAVTNDLTGTTNILFRTLVGGAVAERMRVNSTGVTIAGALDHDGSTVGLYGVTPVARATAIASPTGGATQDAEARTAIDAIRVALTNIGITA